MQKGATLCLNSDKGKPEAIGIKINIVPQNLKKEIYFYRNDLMKGNWILVLTCSRRFSGFGGLIATRNVDLGADNAIKTTRSCHGETVLMLAFSIFLYDSG